MSSSNYGQSADTVSIDFVKEQCPETFEALNQILSDADVSLDDFFVAKYFDGDYETCNDNFETEDIDKVYEALKADFIEKTGLGLLTVYHDAEERSDELDGGSFAVDGVYVLSEAGEKHKDKIEHKEWTTWG